MRLRELCRLLEDVQLWNYDPLVVVRGAALEDETGIDRVRLEGATSTNPMVILELEPEW